MSVGWRDQADIESVHVWVPGTSAKSRILRLESVYTCVYVRACILVCVRACLHACMRSAVHVCFCARVCVCVCLFVTYQKTHSSRQECLENANTFDWQPTLMPLAVLSGRVSMGMQVLLCVGMHEDVHAEGLTVMPKPWKWAYLMSLVFLHERDLWVFMYLIYSWIVNYERTDTSGERSNALCCLHIKLWTTFCTWFDMWVTFLFFF